MTDGIRKKLWVKQETDLVYRTNIYIVSYKHYTENNLKQWLEQKK